MFLMLHENTFRQLKFEFGYKVNKVSGQTAFYELF